MIRADNLATIEFTDPSTVRLISTACIDEPAMAPLADDEEDLAVLEDIEGLTSARQSVNLPVPGGIRPGELLTDAAGYGWTMVNAAFCYTRSTGSRFNGSERGAWYATYGDLAVETAHAEVAWHLTRELEATGVYQNTTCYRELLAGFTSRFHQLEPTPSDDVGSADPTVAYPAGQILARDVLDSGGNGILYPSARLPKGQCLVALRPHLVQNIRPGATWEFVWEGKPTPRIAKR